jgi:hypothetical protein
MHQYIQNPHLIVPSIPWHSGQRLPESASPNYVGDMNRVASLQVSKTRHRPRRLGRGSLIIYQMPAARCQVKRGVVVPRLYAFRRLCLDDVGRQLKSN